MDLAQNFASIHIVSTFFSKYFFKIPLVSDFLLRSVRILIHFWLHAPLKFHTRDIQKVLVVITIGFGAFGLHQDLVGGQNIVPEDCKCAGEHPEQSSEVYPTVAPQVSKKIPMNLMYLLYSGFR